MIQSDICTLLGITYPIFQGGMAWIADGKLAAAVSNGGGLGIISAMNASADYLKQQIEIASSLTDKPFGVNIMLMSPHADEVADVVVECGVRVVTTGAGSPEKYMKKWLDAGVKVIPVICFCGYGKKNGACRCACDYCRGTESGGHIGELTTMALVPQVCDAVSIPVLAAGGIADGRRDGCFDDAGRMRRSDGNALFGCTGVRCSSQL